MLVYDHPGSTCLGKCQTGVAAMRDAIEAYFPGSYHLGCYSCRNIGDTASPSTHREGRANDTGFAMVDGKANPAGWVLARWLVANADAFGIQLVIFDRRCWSVGRANEGFRQYVKPKGGSDHLDHVHSEQNWDSARHLTRAVIDAHPPADASEEDDMPPKTVIRGTTGPQHAVLPNGTFELDADEKAWLVDAGFVREETAPLHPDKFDAWFGPVKP